MSGDDLWKVEHPHLVLRRVSFDSKGNPIGSPRVQLLPEDRTLEAAMAWAAKEYADPTRPQTPATPEDAQKMKVKAPPPSAARRGRL